MFDANWLGQGTGMMGYAPAGMVAFLPFMILFSVWSIFWKGLALWHSAKRKEPYWFIAMLIINTAGILEIIYLFGIAKVKTSDWFKK